MRIAAIIFIENSFHGAFRLRQWKQSGVTVVRVFYVNGKSGVVAQYHSLHGARDKVGDGQTLGNASAYLGAADVEQGNVEHADRGWQLRTVYLAASARIDGDGEAVDYLLRLIPAVEMLPVVAANDERELAVGKLLAHSGERGVHIRRSRQVELVVGGHKSAAASQSLPHYLQANVVVHQSLILLQWVLRRYHKPNLVEVGLPEQGTSQCDVPFVNRVERTSENACFHDSWLTNSKT